MASRLELLEELAVLPWDNVADVSLLKVLDVRKLLCKTREINR